MIIPATTAHLGQIHALEQAVSPAPWTQGQFGESLKHHLCNVLLKGDEVAGFVIFTCLADAAELLNIAVNPASQGQGLGSHLLDFCLKSVKDKADSIFLEVRASNFPAISLYLNKGFVQIGERRDYYPRPGGREDALIMACQLKVD